MTTTTEALASLASRIMNLPTRPEVESWPMHRRLDYKGGHRDARHAAAELVSAALAQAEQPEPVRHCRCDGAGRLAPECDGAGCHAERLNEQAEQAQPAATTQLMGAIGFTCAVFKASDAPPGTPVYLAAPPAAPQPTEMSPDLTDTARAALLWVLWHHQGGSSPVGQPIRFALGMGAHERLNEHQVAEAKRWAALTKSATADFHAAPQPQAAQQADAQADKRAEHKAFSTWLLSLHPKRLEECIGPDDVAWLAWKARAMLAAAPTQAAQQAKPCEWTNCPTRVGDKCCNEAAPNQAAPLVALTEDQVFASQEFMHLNGSLPQLAMPQLMLLVRAIERAHGIHAQEGAAQEGA